MHDNTRLSLLKNQDTDSIMPLIRRYATCAVKHFNKTSGLCNCKLTLSSVTLEVRMQCTGSAQIIGRLQFVRV
jgi:hypothetical protein